MKPHEETDISPIAETVSAYWCDRCRLKHYGEHVCDLGSVRFGRHDTHDYGFGREATYRAYCPTCNTAFDIRTDADRVRRYENVGSEADAPRARDGDLALATWLVADALCGDLEKRAHNREVDRWEAMLRIEAMRQLGHLCPHVGKQ